jgi:hypothetical protein
VKAGSRIARGAFKTSKTKFYEYGPPLVDAISSDAGKRVVQTLTAPAFAFGIYKATELTSLERVRIETTSAEKIATQRCETDKIISDKTNETQVKIARSGERKAE